MSRRPPGPPRYPVDPFNHPLQFLGTSRCEGGQKWDRMVRQRKVEGLPTFSCLFLENSCNTAVRYFLAINLFASPTHLCSTFVYYLNLCPPKCLQLGLHQAQWDCALQAGHALVLVDFSAWHKDGRLRGTWPCGSGKNTFTGWAQPRIRDEYTVSFAETSSNIRSYTAYIHTVLAKPNYMQVVTIPGALIQESDHCCWAARPKIVLTTFIVKLRTW